MVYSQKNYGIFEEKKDVAILSVCSCVSIFQYMVEFSHKFAKVGQTPQKCYPMLIRMVTICMNNPDESFY